MNDNLKCINVTDEQREACGNNAFAMLRESFDTELKARGFSDNEIEAAKEEFSLYAKKRVDSVVCQQESIMLSECADVLLLYMLGAGIHFTEKAQ